MKESERDDDDEEEGRSRGTELKENGGDGFSNV